MTFFDLLIEHFFSILLLVLSPYIFYYFFHFYKLGKKKMKEDSQSSEIIQTFEEEKLGIRIENTDPRKYKKRMDNLIELLQNSKGKIKVSAVEAIMLVEQFSKSVLVNQDGSIVIDMKTANNFANDIFNDPMKFITYIKAIESKIDLENNNNKTDLADVLYMMRNARKFGLNLEDDDSKLIMNIKSAIHKSDYEDVVIDIVIEKKNRFNNSKKEKLINKIITPTCEGRDEIKSVLTDAKIMETEKMKKTKIIDGIFVDEERDKENSKEFLNENTNIESVVRLENGHVQIISKDGIVIEKDDVQIYSIVDLNAEVEKNNNKGNINSNNTIDKLNETVQNALEEKEKEKNKLDEYIKSYGELDHIETKYKTEMRFKDRARDIFDEQILGTQKFETSEFSNKCFFKDENTLIYFLIKMFDVDNAIVQYVPYIFIGDISLKNKEPFRYISIDINYLIQSMYVSMRREDRESFFKYIYSNNKMNENNIEKIIENINKEYSIFQSFNTHYIGISIYRYGDKNIKTSILRFEIPNFEEYLAEENELRENYAELKSKLYGNIKTTAFGKKAEDTGADVVLNQDTFFRKPSIENI